MIYVTHDQIEAMTLGDRVAVMRSGVLQQVDSPRELYNTPHNLFVAGFIGSQLRRQHPRGGRPEEDDDRPPRSTTRGAAATRGPREQGPQRGRGPRGAGAPPPPTTPAAGKCRGADRGRRVAGLDVYAHFGFQGEDV